MRVPAWCVIGIATYFLITPRLCNGQSNRPGNHNGPTRDPVGLTPSVVTAWLIQASSPELRRSLSFAATRQENFALSGKAVQDSYSGSGNVASKKTAMCPTRDIVGLSTAARAVPSHLCADERERRDNGWYSDLIPETGSLEAALSCLRPAEPSLSAAGERFDLSWFLPTLRPRPFRASLTHKEVRHGVLLLSASGRVAP
jgi:hypothetical protein